MPIPSSIPSRAAGQWSMGTTMTAAVALGLPENRVADPSRRPTRAPGAPRSHDAGGDVLVGARAKAVVARGTASRASPGCRVPSRKYSAPLTDKRRHLNTMSAGIYPGRDGCQMRARGDADDGEPLTSATVSRRVRRRVGLRSVPVLKDRRPRPIPWRGGRTNREIAGFMGAVATQHHDHIVEDAKAPGPECAAGPRSRLCR
jgi:hypothetical protein